MTMKRKSLNVIAAASGLPTADLRDLVESLTRLMEGRDAGADPQPKTSRIIVEQRRMRSATLQLELVKCGKPRCRACKAAPAHGPYWYAYWKHEGRMRTKYIGKELPESFTAYEKDYEGGYIGQTFAVPRSYVTRHRTKGRRLHKTTKRGDGVKGGS
jgi:hypothetical protein